MRGISIQRMLVDDALTQRRTDARLIGGRGPGDVDIDGLVGELMRLRGELGRAGNIANQAVRDARRLESETTKFANLNDAIEAVREIARAASDARETAMKLGRLR